MYGCKCRDEVLFQTWATNGSHQATSQINHWLSLLLVTRLADYGELNGEKLEDSWENQEG